MSIVLRPHHLLCTQGYSGKGYDNDFVAHMTDVVHQLRDVHAVFVGTTEWTDEAAGRARIEVSFLDDLVALRAFRDAIAFLGDAMVR